MGQKVINKVEDERVLQVIIQDDMSPVKYINRIVREEYRLLINRKVTFNYMYEDKLIMSIVRSKLEYVAVVWSPHLKTH